MIGTRKRAEHVLSTSLEIASTAAAKAATAGRSCTMIVYYRPLKPQGLAPSTISRTARTVAPWPMGGFTCKRIAMLGLKLAKRRAAVRDPYRLPTWTRPVIKRIICYPRASFMKYCRHPGLWFSRAAHPACPCPVPSSAVPQ